MLVVVVWLVMETLVGVKVIVWLTVDGNGGGGGGGVDSMGGADGDDGGWCYWN